MKKNLKKNNKVELKNKIKANKKVPFSKGEMIFNVISLLFAIGVGLYYGGRSFYYYSKLAAKQEQLVMTLNGTILSSNYTVTTGDGLHQDKDGYYFKGNVSNNYVLFANRVFRIIRVNNDGSVKLVSQNIASEFMWGEDSNYVNSNLDKWLDKKEMNGSGIYYNTIPEPKTFLSKTSYNIATFDGKTVTDNKDKLSSYVTTLSIKDYSLANGKNSYLNTKNYFWLIGQNADGSNLYVSEDGSLLEGNLYESYGVRPVITLKANMQITGGNGNVDTPYIINQGDKINLVDSYVTLGNDVWKVFYDDGNIVKLAFTNYISNGIPYSNKNSLFNISNRRSIAYYLNNTYLNMLSYKDKLLDMQIFTGEVSSDTSLDYMNIYSNHTVGKVGIWNVFDYQNLGGDDYYLSTTSSSVGSMVYVYHNYGLLAEAKVTDTKNVIPIIAVSKNSIVKDNTGKYIVR